MGKLNWQTKVLIGFLIFWLLMNFEKMFFNVVTFIVMIPLNIHAFAGNLLGFETWSKVITFLNSPITILICAIITFTALLKICKLIHRLIFKNQ